VLKLPQVQSPNATFNGRKGLGEQSSWPADVCAHQMHLHLHLDCRGSFSCSCSCSCAVATAQWRSSGEAALFSAGHWRCTDVIWATFELLTRLLKMMKAPQLIGKMVRHFLLFICLLKEN